MVLNEKGDGTNISIDIELKLSLKAIILQPLIKKWYKRILTSTLYKINNSIMNNSQCLNKIRIYDENGRFFRDN